MPRLAAVLAALTLAGAAHAQGIVAGVSPPAVEAGTTTRVTFTGRDLGAALDVWHSLPTGALTAKVVSSSPTNAVFDITTAKHAPVGVCGLRLATRDGLTNAILFLVDDLPVRPGESTLTPPAAVWGSFREGAVDRYTLTVKAGERVGFEAVANRFGKDSDPLVTVRDSAGRFVAEWDNDPGLYFDFRREHTFAAAGTYTLDVRDARFQGGDHRHYVLRVGKFPAGRVAVPAAATPGGNAVSLPEVPGATFRVTAPAGASGPAFVTVKRPGDDGSAWVPVDAVADGPLAAAREPDDKLTAAFEEATSPAAVLAFRLSPLRTNPFLGLDRLLHTGRLQPTPAVVPGVLGGVLRTPGRPQGFRISLAKGQRVVARAEAEAINSPADLELYLTDRFGKEVRRGTIQKGEEPSLDFTATQPGDYGLFVRDTLRDGSPAHAYRLTVRADPFLATLTAAVEGLTVPQGSYQPVPIAVARPQGTSGPFKLTLLGAPPGVRLTPDAIGEKDTAIVCRLEADASAPLGVHTVQIRAESPDGATMLVRTQPLIDKRIHNADLILHALREDQRRLPPSVADRFAVQITPPPPFTFELPEPSLTLVRFLKVDVPVATTRVPGFDGPITFTAKGGQLAPKEEGRTRVYAEFPAATPDTPRTAGFIKSLILSNLQKSRIDVSATGIHAGRRVTLTRTFDLDVTAGFKVAADMPKVSLLPGESARVTVTATRQPGFDGPVTVRLLQPSQLTGLSLPETITLPKGVGSVEIDVAVAADAQPRKTNLQIVSSGEVGEYEEEVRGNLFELEIRKVDPPKKK